MHPDELWRHTSYSGGNKELDVYTPRLEMLLNLLRSQCSHKHSFCYLTAAALRGKTNNSLPALQHTVDSNLLEDLAAKQSNLSSGEKLPETKKRVKSLDNSEVMKITGETMAFLCLMYSEVMPHSYC